ALGSVRRLACVRPVATRPSSLSASSRESTSLGWLSGRSSGVSERLVHVPVRSALPFDARGVSCAQAHPAVATNALETMTMILGSASAPSIVLSPLNSCCCEGIIHHRLNSRNSHPVHGRCGHGVHPAL